MNVKTLNVGQVSVGTTPVQILAANTDRVRVTISGGYGGQVFFGPNNSVSTTNGFGHIGDSGLLVLEYTGAIWAVAASAGQPIAFAEEATA